MNNKIYKIWGETVAFLKRTRRFGWIDAVFVLGLGGVLYFLIQLAEEWTGILRPTVEIDLSPWALPKYTFFSMCRGMLAYTLSCGFTIVYGYWAAKDRIAEKILIPLLDILQSIPVLGFMPGLVLALVSLFPRSNIGIELAAVIMIFTGQAWNMTFSFYHSIRSIPGDLTEVAGIYRLSWWQRFRLVELPFSTIGFVWNSMMSMAGGWFFLMISESFVLGGNDFRLPGIGSYMSIAVAQGNVPSMIWAIIAMITMIVLLDQLLWRPVVVWAQKFRFEESGPAEVIDSWFLNFIRQSHIVDKFVKLANYIWKSVRQWLHPVVVKGKLPENGKSGSTVAATAASVIFFLLFIGAMLYGTMHLAKILWRVDYYEWTQIGLSAFLTLGRVLTATAVGTLWTVPAGLAIGLSPRLSKMLQPVVQVVASFPAPMLYPMVVWGLTALGIGLGTGSIVLMLLGTQWYILFNVIAGAMAIPADLQESARSFKIQGWQRFQTLYLPSIFPYLVTGWVTAAGGAWNASIVSEYVMFRGRTISTSGLGAMVSSAAEKADFPMLAGSIFIMSIMVVAFNRLVWRRFYQIAQERYSLNK